MNPEIHPISFSIVSSYLLRGDGYVLVDAGTPGQIKPFLKQLEEFSLHPDEIDLIVCTHGHMDHIGIARDIKALTGAKLAIHKREREWLESGTSPLPPGTMLLGKLLSYLGQRIPPITVPPAIPDILIDDDGISLAEYEVPGVVVYTPGHTLGSVSILLEDGSAFVGDLAMSARFMRLTPGLPIFAEDLDLVKRSWLKLLDLGAETIYPAHGKPFSADVFRKMV
jgi:glyoxylase-like metal-dependent hydrolase (beta-lactamase superfamily II)